MTIIDVRSLGEFMGGHVAGSINIPLPEIPNNMDQIEAMKPPLILCCVSGYRSGQATEFLNQNGITCTNGGSWLDVNNL